MNDGREFDIVLWGATGATGRRAAYHLAARIGDSGLRWAIGGRSAARLKAVRAGLPQPAQGVPVLVGDSHDAAFMAAMTARTRVVVSTVGPFALYGSELLAACVANGTHYCDLTGESHWMRAMIDAHLPKAQATGARIVFSCGHDSIPSDLGVFFLQNTAIRRFGQPCKRIATRITAMKGGFSGGTAASFVNAMETIPNDPGYTRLMADPYALNPEGQRQGPDGPDRMMPVSVTYDDDLKIWTNPYFMASMNAKVVRRSNALLGYRYGRDFQYQETAATRGGLGGWWAAMRYTLMARAFLTAMAIPFSRGMLKRHVLPKSGEGPDAETRRAGFYEIVQVGEQPDGRLLKARIVGRGDPGVESTTRMLVEAGLCLAEDEANIAVGGGFWTPASAFGRLLRDRITAHAGLSFELV